MRFLNLLIATGMGLGFFPFAPGTAGALGGCLIAVILQTFSPYANEILPALIVAFFFLGSYSAGKMEEEWGKDPSKVVIDEFVGIWIAMWMIPPGWLYVIMSVVFFRLFDIFKPLFIRKAEKLKGGWGIMTDDVIAGIYANGAVQIIHWLIR